MMKDKKSILIISEVLFPEEFLINDLVNKWSKDLEYEIDILTRNPSYPFGKVYPEFKNKLYQKSDHFNSKIHRYHILPGYKNNTTIKILNYLWNAILSTIIALFLFRKRKNIFIYHTGPLTLALPGIILKKLFGSKVTIWTQDIWPETIFAFGIKKYRILEFIVLKYVKWVYKNCDNIIVTSPAFKKAISQYVDKEIVFVPNWSENIELNQKNENILKDKFNLSFTGNIGKMQNLETVIQYFHEWAKNDEDILLNIYGDGSHLKQLKQMVNQKSINNIIFYGRVPKTEMPNIYNNSDVLIISLEINNVFDLYIPAKFSSYLSAGKPILGIIEGEVNKLINEYDIGFAFNPSNKDQIIESFKKLFNLSIDDKLKIKNNSKRLLLKHFDKDSNIRIIEEVIWDKVYNGDSKKLNQ